MMALQDFASRMIVPFPLDSYQVTEPFATPHEFGVVRVDILPTERGGPGRAHIGRSPQSLGENNHRMLIRALAITGESPLGLCQ